MFFCTNKQCTNYTKPIQLANWNCLLCFMYIHICTNYTKWIQMLIESYEGCWCFLYIQKLFIVYFSNFTSATTSSSVLLSQLSKISEPVLLKKIQRWIYVIYLSSINLIYFSFNNYYIFLKCILWQNEVFKLRVRDSGNTIHFSFLRTQFFPSSQKITIPKHKKGKEFFL